MLGEYRTRLIRKFLIDHEATQIQRSCPYTPRPNDVIICGYFRAGACWLQQILHQIRMGGADESYDDIDRVVWYAPAYMERLEFDLNGDQPSGLIQCRLFRCNDCWEDSAVPAERDAGMVKYVVMVRDPMDVAWSEATSHYRNLGVDKDYDHAALTQLTSTAPSRQSEKHTMARPVYYPTYWEHLLSWWPQRKHSTVFWLHYEDLEKDLRVCIVELARFIGVQLTEEQIDAVYQYSTTQYMRENMDKFSGEYLIKLRSDMLAIEPWRPLVGRITRQDGARSGLGALNLSEKIRAKIRWNWRHSIEKLTGYRSYAQMLAENSLVGRVRTRDKATTSKTVKVREDPSPLRLL